MARTLSRGELCPAPGEHLKQWNSRFFVLAGKFLLYYPRKAKTELPTTACLLTNVTVTVDEAKKVRGAALTPGAVPRRRRLTRPRSTRRAVIRLSFFQGTTPTLFTFRVRTLKVEFILAAQTAEERAKWVAAIDTAGRWWSTTTFDARFQEVGQAAAEAEALPTDLVHFDEDATQRPDGNHSDEDK